MRNKNPGILIFGLTEIIIGLSTLSAVTASALLSLNEKPPNVLIFVIATAVISFTLGTGIIFYQRWTRKLLIFFASAIILSKILIFAKIIYLNGALETSIPSNIKNLFSIVYHSSLLLYLNLKPVEKLFKE